MARKQMQMDADTVFQVLAEAMDFKAFPVGADDCTGEDKITPCAIRSFLASLRLLDSVPFNNIVPDSSLLPVESIRFFYVDRAWTDALTQGALSVGTVNTSDRAQLEQLYPEIEREVDEEERRVRQPGSEAVQGGKAGLITGFLLRSRAVSGWPGLHVRAYRKEPGETDEDILPETHTDRIKLLRLERLAPAVLLALFDGLPRVVHIEEPRQGLQFGVSLEAIPGNFNSYTASVPARDVKTAGYVDDDGEPVETAAEAHRLPVLFRPGSPGVLDLANTGKRFRDFEATNISTDGILDGAEFALEMIRFPYRQVFGDPSVIEDPDIRAVFRPTIGREITTLINDFGRLIDGD